LNAAVRDSGATWRTPGQIGCQKSWSGKQPRSNNVKKALAGLAAEATTK
jgi:hypothetical protein